MFTAIHKSHNQKYKTQITCIANCLVLARSSGVGVRRGNEIVPSVPTETACGPTRCINSVIVQTP